MIPAFDVFPALLVEVEREETYICEGQKLASPIVYMPVSAPNITGGDSHHCGYRFHVNYPEQTHPRVAMVLVNQHLMHFEVIVGEGESFNPHSGLPSSLTRHVKRPDFIFIPKGIVKDCKLSKALKNEAGEDIALRFSFEITDVKAVAEMVIQFLLNSSQPATVKYL